ncbi:protein arginine N-methyltransferase 7 isoform X2 [Pectinophora gossypiella]|nr:protein arginine N-methyltransferase 7 isoform X2 [Pectinophora gossypiella]
MNVFTQKRNPITGATEWDMQHEDYDYHQEIARSAFADMLHDTERNKKYHRALQLAIEKMHEAGKPANVLDIGTGTGLLSIMAARAGADSIVACEAFKPMAECCRKILEQNGVANKITLIPKRSTDLTVGEDGDMKQKANILVTEVFDTELIGEGALSTFSHAHKYLLEEDCIVVPDSAVVYAQVVDCPTMEKWHKLQDINDEILNLHLKTPQNIKDCSGIASVHDLQLSQLPRRTFTELSEQLAIFYYDWSGRTPIDMKRTVHQKFTATTSGTGQMVFVWWDLNMDTEGKIVLSCAPWWSHPAANIATEHPEDTIPWRDHWMQAIYYFAQPLPVKYDTEYTLVCCQDEYSFWFFLEDGKSKPDNYQRPNCECGVHVALSRTHVGYLNNQDRCKMYLKEIKKQMKEIMNPVVLDLNGTSLMGLATAQIGAKSVYIIETNSLFLGILEAYVRENKINNVKFISEKDVDDDILRDVSMVVCDPNFTSAILPWENLRMAHILYQFKNKLRHDIVIIPEKCEFFTMPVEFLDLHKIRIPLGKCEGIDMKIFDDLVESSRQISDAELEAQPLWEYPCFSRGVPRKLLEIDMLDLQATYANNESFKLAQPEDGEQVVNGFAIWTVWTIGDKQHSTGPTEAPKVGDRIKWDPHTRQAVKILKNTFIVKCSDMWKFQVACDLSSGQFNMSIDLVGANHKPISKLGKMSTTSSVTRLTSSRTYF